MYYLKPSFYDDFRCLAGDCPDTCCQGWQILIDPESMERFQKDPELWNYVQDSIETDPDGENPRYALKDRHCMHLAPDGLCGMQVRFGEKALCGICRMYPRHMEEFDGEREFSLDLSCPEAARMILTSPIPELLSSEDEKEETEDYDDFDYLLYTSLSEARDRIFERIADPSVPAVKLMEELLSLGAQYQDAVDEDEVFRMAEIAPDPEFHPFSYDSEKELFSVLHDLEVLRPEWPEVVRRTEEQAFSSEENWKAADEFLRRTVIEEAERRLLWYMVYVYFDGAVYNYDLYEKTAFIVYSVRWTIFTCYALLSREDGKAEMAAGKTADGKMVPEGGKEQDLTSLLIDSAYVFSREVGHSDENINRLEEWFSARR